MTARSNGAARGVTRSEETWASPPTESPGKVLSPRIARARAGDREACDETTRGTRPETRTRAPVRQAGVRARRDVWPMRARRRCYVNSHVGSDAIKSCSAFFARTSIDSQVYARVFFCVFYTRANSLRIPGTSARHKFSRPKRAANPRESFSLPARRSSQISSRGNGETSRRRAGVSLARASVPRARPRASPDRGSRSARSPFPRPGDRRAVPTSLFGGRALRAGRSNEMADGSAAKAVRHRATERGRSTSPSPRDARAISPTRRRRAGGRVGERDRGELGGVVVVVVVVARVVVQGARVRVTASGRARGGGRRSNTIDARFSNREAPGCRGDGAGRERGRGHGGGAGAKSCHAEATRSVGSCYG